MAELLDHDPRLFGSFCRMMRPVAGDARFVSAMPVMRPASCSSKVLPNLLAMILGEAKARFSFLVSQAERRCARRQGEQPACRLPAGSVQVGRIGDPARGLGAFRYQLHLVRESF